jgi:riboflavin synthase
MFTGIVEELGAVIAQGGGRLIVRSPVVASDSAVGDSIAIGGVCLTVVARDADQLAFDLSEETLERTTLGTLRPGARVNVERPATLASRLGGHLVQGHVDGVAEVTGVRPVGADGVRLSVRLPGDLPRHVVEKGSITLDGVSLTVASLDGNVVQIALIPHTLRVTTLGSAGVGDRLHVEVDVVAKYVAKNLEYLTTDGAAVVRPGKERTA